MSVTLIRHQVLFIESLIYEFILIFQEAAKSYKIPKNNSSKQIQLRLCISCPNLLKATGLYKCACVLSPGLIRIITETTKWWLFQRVYLCIWTIAGQKLSTLSIRVFSSLTVHDNLWTLKFHSFSAFQNVISESPNL